MPGGGPEVGGRGGGQLNTSVGGADGFEEMVCNWKTRVGGYRVRGGVGMFDATAACNALIWFSGIVLLPQKLDHPSCLRFGSLLAIGSMSFIAWKKASNNPSATQLSTRSRMRYFSSTEMASIAGLGSTS